MGIFEQFPYTDFHNLNLDWIIKVLKEYGVIIHGLDEKIKDAIEQGLKDLDIMKIILDAMSEYGLVINVKAPPNGLPSASGNGSTDDTITIQGCIDYANSRGGGAIFFPSGGYLTQPLVLKSNVSLVAFDPSTSRLVLKGGATKPFLTGDVENCTITNLTLDGNMDIQINNIDLIDISAKDLIIHNVKLKDGYNLLKVNAKGCVRGSLIDFGKGVIDALITTGNGEVAFSELIFHELSTLNGRYIINNNVDNALFNNIYSTVLTDVAIYNRSNKSAFIGRILNAINTIDSTGVDTYTNFYERGGSGTKALEDETLARINADNVLRNELEEEILNRTNADSVLRNDIDINEIASIMQDDILQENIDTETQARIDTDNVLRNELEEEILNRTNVDNVLRNDIDNEVYARIELQEDINNVNSGVINLSAYPRLVGDTSDSPRINRALLDLKERGCLMFSGGIIEIVEPIIISKKHVSITSKEETIIMAMRNIESCFILRSESDETIQYGTKIENIFIDGADFSNYGILLHDTVGLYISTIYIDRVTTQRCLLDGILCVAPCWIVDIDRCTSAYNGRDGIRIVRDSLLQINAITVSKSFIHSNGGNGITLNGSSHKVVGNIIERNIHGVSVNGTVNFDDVSSSLAIENIIVNNYIEINSVSQIHVKSGGMVIAGIVVNYNFCLGSSNMSHIGDSILKCEGVTDIGISVNSNAFLKGEGNVTFDVDGGDCLSEESVINDIYHAKNLKYASSRIIGLGVTPISTKLIENAIYNVDGISENIVALENKFIQFPMPDNMENRLVKKCSVYVNTDSSNYTIRCRYYVKDLRTGLNVRNGYEDVVKNASGIVDFNLINIIGFARCKRFEYMFFRFELFDVGEGTYVNMYQPYVELTYL